MIRVPKCSAFNLGISAVFKMSVKFAQLTAKTPEIAKSAYSNHTTDYLFCVCIVCVTFKLMMMKGMVLDTMQ